MAKNFKSGGRKRGVPNKVTRDVREALALLAERNIARFEDWLTQIQNPAKRCEVFLRAIEYHLPKQRQHAVSVDAPPMEIKTQIERARRVVYYLKHVAELEQRLKRTDSEQFAQIAGHVNGER